MEKGMQGFLFGILVGVFGCLGFQMFKDGDTTALNRLRQPLPSPTKKKPVRVIAQTPISVRTGTTLGLASDSAKTGGDGVYTRIDEKPLPSVPVITETDSVQVEENTDENNNPIAQNRPFTFTPSTSGGRF